MSKKILIPLIILAVLLATGLGIYIASNQSARPNETPNNRPAASRELAITEINRTYTPPDDLGKTTYQTNGPVSILLYSEAYERLNGCTGHHIAELVLSDTQAENTTSVGGQYKYAKLILQPMGECGSEDGRALADAISYMVATGK